MLLTVAAVGCKAPTSPYVSHSLLQLPLTAAKRRGRRDFATSLSDVSWLTAARSSDHLL